MTPDQIRQEINHHIWCLQAAIQMAMQDDDPEAMNRAVRITDFDLSESVAHMRWALLQRK